VSGGEQAYISLANLGKPAGANGFWWNDEVPPPVGSLQAIANIVNKAYFKKGGGQVGIQAMNLALPGLRPLSSLEVDEQILPVERRRGGSGSGKKG
jgi:hypothetical protein